MGNRYIASFVLVLLMGGVAFGQSSGQAPPESHKYRTILTIAGAGGGFVAGVFIGIAAFDDAVNSDRKVWTTSIIGAGAGGVGGYFIGRALDHRKRKTAGISIPLAATELRISPLVSTRGNGLQLALRF
jgi:hypothetical protein